MRTHLEVDPGVGLRGLEGVLPLIKEYAWAIDLQICVFPQEGLLNNPGTDELMVEALERGCRAVGGAPYVDTNPPGQIDRIFELAREYDIDIDLHLDFGPTADGMDLEHVCKRTEEFQYGGRVAIGHVTKAASLSMPAFDATAKRLADAGVALTVLAVDRSLPHGPPSHARSQRHARRRAGAQAPASRRQLLAVEQQYPQSVHAVRRLLADAHGESLRQYLSGRETGRHARVLQHGDAASGADDAALGLWAGGRQIRRSCRARFDEPGNGRCRAHAGALRLQARPQDRVAAARDAAPAAMIPNDPYNAFCRQNHVERDGAPDGPLRGLTFAVKDVFDIAGHRTGNGNPVWLETHPPATRTASAVERLLAAGARMVGKTHTDELAYSLNGENVHYGTPINPRAPGPDSRRFVERIGGWRLPAVSSISRSAAIAAARCGCRRAIAASTASAPRTASCRPTASSISPKASTQSAGSRATRQ